MNRWFKRLGAAFLVLLVLASGAALWWLLIPGRAPAKRPDLVRLPENAPVAPRGFPTMNAGIVAYVLGLARPLDIDAEPDLNGVLVERDVEYGRAGDRPLLLDVYRPATPADAPVPALMFIHGGGWAGGDKRDYQYYTAKFAQRGYVCVSIGYRFVREAKYPAAIQDAKCAMRWLRANAPALGADPDRIVAIGGSAGGHLAMLLGYSADEPALEGDSGHAGISSRANAVVNLYGPTDLTADEARDNPTVTRFFGHGYEENPAAYAMASPLHHVDPSDPPTLIIQGTIDNIVPVGQADLLAERFQALGMPYWYARVDGWPHTMDIFPAPNAYVQALLVEFIGRVFDPARPL
jgi:acetyl esterase/lipase